MEKLLARLKRYDPARGYVLRHYSYAGIRFHHGGGFCSVEKNIADDLRSVHELPSDPSSPLAFDVCTEAEAKTFEASAPASPKGKRGAAEEHNFAPESPTGILTTASLPKPSSPASKDADKDTRRGKRERE